jgi:hypothetical protein
LSPGEYTLDVMVNQPKSQFFSNTTMTYHPLMTIQIEP